MFIYIHILSFHLFSYLYMMGLQSCDDTDNKQAETRQTKPNYAILADIMTKEYMFSS